MSRIVTILLFCAFSAALAQENKASRFRPGFMWFYTGLKPAKNGSPKYDRLMADITYNSWQTDSAIVQSGAGSIGFNLHTMFDIPLARYDVVSLGIGLSYRFQKINFDGRLVYTDQNGTRLELFDLPQSGLEKFQFRSSSFAMPVELRFRTPRWNHVKIHIGGYVGYRTTVKSKFWLHDEKYVSRQFPDANRVCYGVTARVGFRNIALFADYSISPQFGSNSESKIQPISAGLTISVF